MSTNTGIESAAFRPGAAAHGLLPTPLDRRTVWLHIFAGLCASLVGIGLARFAYTPLIPPLIQAHWFSATDVI